jgi:hypothetical protein
MARPRLELELDPDLTTSHFTPLTHCSLQPAGSLESCKLVQRRQGR